MVDEIPPGLLAAIVFRLDRCAWHDQMAMLHLFNNTFEKITEDSSHSAVLQRHVAMSELWPPDAPSEEELSAELDDYVMSTEVSVSFAATAGSWPQYPAPADGARFPDFTGPMLLLHGGLDPTTPPERLEELRYSYGGSEQYFVLFPDAGHVVLNEAECARSIYRDFLEAPDTSPDTSCLSDVPTLDFSVSAEDAVRLLGTSDLWGDRVPPMPSILFLALYRWGAPIVGVSGFLIVLIGRWRRRQSDLSTFRLVFGSAAWLLVTVLFWQGLFFLPYLCPYLAIGTVAVAVAALAIQVAIAWWFRRRLSSGSRLGFSRSER